MNIISPESQGFSSPRLGRIHTVMQRYVDERKLAGVIALIARRGELVYLDPVGMAVIEGGQPMTADTIFRIYSMTKPVTSTAVLMLYEEGRFRLTDPVADYLPEFKEMKVLDNQPGSGVKYIPASRPISIRDLLTHTAGLSYGLEDKVYIDELYRKHIWAAQDANPKMTLSEAVVETAKLPLAHQPGTLFRYSLATDVLGFLVQVVSGQPFEGFLKQRIFDPLGMVDSSFYVPAEKVGRFSAVYGPDAEHGLKVTDPVSNPQYLNPPARPSGGGGMVSTSGDYLRFCQMLLNGGALEGVRLLGRKTVELMTTNHLPDGIYCFDDHSTGFGLGVSVLLDPAKAQMPGSVGNYSWSGAANTHFWIDPKEEMIAILMLQFMPIDTYPVIHDFHILAYQAMV